MPDELAALNQGASVTLSIVGGQPPVWLAVTLTLEPIYRVAFEGRAVGWRARQFDIFARFDGFRDWTELVEFWLEENGAIDRFDGYHIRWQPLPAELI